MAENDQEKTEQATSRRREKAREEGQVASSREVSSFFVILAGLLVIYFAGAWFAAQAAGFMRESFSSITTEMSVKEAVEFFKGTSLKLLAIAAPAFVIPFFGAVSYILQNGFNVSNRSITPELSKINPVSGMKKLVSLRSIAELVKSLLKVSIISYVVYRTIAAEWSNMPFLVDMEPVAGFAYIARIGVEIMARTVWVLALIAIIDYLYQRYEHEKSLRMSKEEVRDEMKELEGDPMVKARIRSIQRDIARKRMMQEVPGADAVVTNPTRLAVAVKYDRHKAGAPLVVAKGAGFVAKRIREIARENGVPVIEDKPLARSLFKYVEVGMEIPVSLYRAVAELLAYVYRLKAERRAH